jgi:hypothetical protein
MDEDLKIEWQRAVDKFTLHKSGMNPWDALLLSKQLPGCSNAERQVILFLLHAWDPGGDWPEKFDFIEAFRSWDVDNKQAFIDWCDAPIWP